MSHFRFPVLFDILCKIRLVGTEPGFKRFCFCPKREEKKQISLWRLIFLTTCLKLCLLFSFQNYVNVEDCLEAYESENNTWFRIPYWSLVKRKWRSLLYGIIIRNIKLLWAICKCFQTLLFFKSWGRVTSVMSSWRPFTVDLYSGRMVG